MEETSNKPVKFIITTCGFTELVPESIRHVNTNILQYTSVLQFVLSLVRASTFYHRELGRSNFMLPVFLVLCYTEVLC